MLENEAGNEAIASDIVFSLLMTNTQSVQPSTRTLRAPFEFGPVRIVYSVSRQCLQFVVSVYLDVPCHRIENQRSL